MTTMASAPMVHVQVVLDPDDSLQARRLAVRATRPGVAVCRATPQAVSPQLARDVLRALGKRFDVADSPRRADRLWERVTTWLLAENIAELIVIRAHLLPPDTVRQLVRAAAQAVHLTLFMHASDVPATLGEALTDVIVHQVELDRYARRIPASTVTHAPTSLEPLPVLPRDDFLFFQQACADVLAADAFERVWEVIAAARSATDRWLSGHLVARGVAPDRPPKQRVLAFLGALTQCDDSEEALARLRGAQIALLFDDLLIDVDANAFVAAHSASRTTARLDAKAVALLRMYSSPVYAAAGTIALAADTGAPSLARLTMDDIASAGEAVRFGGGEAIVPDHARALVRAQRITRDAQGAQPGDVFLTSHRERNKAASPAALGNMLARIGHQTGLAMPDGSMSPGSWWHEPSRAVRVREL